MEDRKKALLFEFESKKMLVWGILKLVDYQQRTATLISRIRKKPGSVLLVLRLSDSRLKQHLQHGMTNSKKDKNKDWSGEMCLCKCTCAHVDMDKAQLFSSLHLIEVSMWERPVIPLWRLSEMLNKDVDHLSNGFIITVKVFENNTFPTCKPSVINQVFSETLQAKC